MNYQTLPFKASLLAIAVALTACGGGSKKSSSSSADNIDVIDKVVEAIPEVIEEAPLPTYQLNLNGGNGREGGEGGSVYIQKSNTSAAINISAEATLKAPVIEDLALPSVSTDLGSNSLQVSSDLTIDVDITEPTLGQLYIYEGALYEYDGQMSEVEEGSEGGEGAESAEPTPVYGSDGSRITGIQIDSGVTLSLSSLSSPSIMIELEGDIINKGTITTNNSSNNSHFSLYLSTRVYAGNGTIQQNSANFALSAGLINNAGTIDTSGIDGAEGGSAGSVYLEALAIGNTGSILADGSDNTDSSAGSGSDISIITAAFANSGLIDASSGTGVNTSYPYGGYVSISSGYSLINTGTIDVSGENALEGENSHGARGGYMNFALANELMPSTDDLEDEALAVYIELTEDVAPTLINTGTLNAEGGSGVGDGGEGGAIYITASEEGSGYIGIRSAAVEESEEESAYEIPAYIEVTGAISLQGGDTGIDGYSGASGGELYVTHASTPESETETRFSGYEQINLNGGDGIDGAGSGGVFYVYTVGDYSKDRISIAAVAEIPEEESDALPVPNVILTSDINLNAGNTATDDTTEYVYGANGGYLEIDSNGQSSIGGSVNIDTNISMNGSRITGENLESSNDNYGGYLQIEAVNDITIAGTISGIGSSINVTPGDTEAEYIGGYGTYMEAYSEQGDIAISADLNFSGGNATHEGGEGGSIELEGSHLISVTGNITLKGGNADASIEETLGGDSGQLSLYSYSEAATSPYTIPSVFTLSGGMGATAGIDGGIYTFDSILDELICIAGYCPVDPEDDAEAVVAP